MGPAVRLPEWVQATISDLPEGFTGKIEINCVDGGVATLSKLETVKPSRCEVVVQTRGVMMMMQKR